MMSDQIVVAIVTYGCAIICMVIAVKRFWDFLNQMAHSKSALLLLIIAMQVLFWTLSGYVWWAFGSHLVVRLQS